MSLLGGLFDKEQMVKDTIQETLENIGDFLQTEEKNFFVIIKPKEDYAPGFYLYKTESGKQTFVKELSIKQVLGDSALTDE